MTAASPAKRPRVRFAPSPTGFLHVGGARTALFNWLYAKKYDGDFLLRIEDTDRQRSTDESTRAIFDGMQWLGLTWDEDVVYQGANVARHYADAHALLDSGAAYRDFTPPSELERLRAEAEARGDAFKFDRTLADLSESDLAQKLANNEPYAIRFRVPEGTTEWPDLVHGRIAFPNKDIEDFIILRSDGTPVYNMAVVSDDIAMGITLVMRGDDHISNTPKQILLYRALGAEVPQFGHVPMIHGTDGKKLSKRHGATAVGDYQHQGLLPQAMLNFLALLGWSPGDDTEVMTLPQLIERFSVQGLHAKAAVFDTKKLEWMNGQHLAHMPIDELAAIVAPMIEHAGLSTVAELTANHAWFCGVLELLRIRARLTDEIVAQAPPFFTDGVEYDPEAVAKQWRDAAATADILEATHDRLASLGDWEPAPMEEALRTLAEERAISGGKIFQPLRVALTGLTVSPGIFDVLLYVGRERSLTRLSRAVAFLRG
ncbi:glutamate--tRNA ligase [Gemmatimonas sp.]|jgi:glutamyl-tRNA synthetase|uniref:glutamate--tRNA ligase n=1 Tax=Gemmatimonas sp. TaxID=1962908 RepID=UPI0039187F8B